MGVEIALVRLRFEIVVIAMIGAMGIMQMR
jgi:hypothetical protein